MPIFCHDIKRKEETAMNEHKFTPSAEEALRLAQEAAGEMGHGYVGTEHLLLGLLREQISTAHQVLTEAGLTDELVVEIIKKSVGAGLPGSNPAQGLTPRARRVIEIAVEDASRGGYGHIGADIITMCSMLRIPVCMHNVDEKDIYRPAAWNAFGMDKEGQDYRACAAYGPLYK